MFLYKLQIYDIVKLSDYYLIIIEKSSNWQSASRFI